MTHARIFALAALTATLSPARGGEPAKQPAAIIVEEQRLTFDPKHCHSGTAMFYWGLGSARVTMRGPQQGRCVFDYQWEVEGAGAYQVHRVRVPLDSGPVVIDAARRDPDPKHHWSSIYTSFTKSQATLIRSAGLAWIEDRIEGSDLFVAHQLHQQGRPLRSAQPGERITLQFTLYADQKFDRLAPRARQGQTATLTGGKTDGWPWLRAASAAMSPGEVRRVRLPARAAAGARAWLPALRSDEQLYLEMKRLPPSGK